MAEPGKGERDLTALLLDVLWVDAPRPELLARYAEAPETLTLDERRGVEAHLAASPAHRDQLRVVRTFVTWPDATMLAGDPKSPDPGPSRR
jgi:hypothetical protein